MDIRHILVDIQHALKAAQEERKGGITDFRKQKQEGTKLLLKGAIQRLLEETKNYPEANSLAQKLSIAKTEEIPAILEKLAELAAEEQPKTFKTPKIPADIKEDVTADLYEIQKCIKAECYRSAVVLCGRVMETALHRKYYEATGNDLLEKAPGTGLGTLIAKLSEHGVKLDPGLPNQIHLINQIRVFSVHTKKETFTPSKTQAEAIVLYTLDILDKLFKPRNSE
jgi:hypothetical protein